VIEQVEQRMEVLEQLGPGEEGLREVDEMLQKVRGLSVDTIMVARLLALRSYGLFAVGRVEEAVAAVRESVASSRALLSYHPQDIRPMRVALAFLTGSDRREMQAEIEKSCEVIYGTAEAFGIFFE